MDSIVKIMLDPYFGVVSIILGIISIYLMFKDDINDKGKDTSQDSNIIISGVSAGLPGQEEVFHKDNLSRLLSGVNCIKPISTMLSNELLEKNVVQQTKNEKGDVVKKPVLGPTDTIQLAATLFPVDLTLYGVPPGLASTMDRAAQVAVAAGLEALRNSGIVDGEGGWELPPHMQQTTGVLYASSFPALGFVCVYWFFH